MTVSIRFDSARIDELIAYYDDYFDGKETLTRWDTEASGQRTIGYTINPDGQATAALISTEAVSVGVFLETTILIE